MPETPVWQLVFVNARIYVIDTITRPGFTGCSTNCYGVHHIVFRSKYQDRYGSLGTGRFHRDLRHEYPYFVGSDDVPAEAKMEATQDISFDRERVFYPAVLIVIASYYALFAAMGRF
jgi:hypothetical protein